MFDALLVSWFLSFGFVPSQCDMVEVCREDIDPAKIATVAEVGISFDIYRLSVYTEMESYQYYYDEIYFTPYRIDYKIGASFRITDGIKFVFEHECDHPVASSKGIYGAHTSAYNYMSSETQLKIVISGGSK